MYCVAVSAAIMRRCSRGAAVGFSHRCLALRPASASCGALALPHRCKRSFASKASPASPSFSTPSSSSPPLRQLHSSSPPSMSSDPAPPVPSSKHSIVGEALSASLDLSSAHIGQVIEVPYATTVGESQQCLWQSTFHQHDRLYTSTPFAQSLSLPSHPLPFSMMLFSTISMTHVDESREVLDLAYDNCVYVRPGLAGDTFRQTFTIKHLRMTSDRRNTILTVGCELHNQRQQLLFTCDKTMLYPMVTHPYKLSPAAKSPPPVPRSHLLEHLLFNADALPRDANLAILRPNQLILHTVARPIGTNTNMSLSTLFRWTHPSIYNTTRYSPSELTVPGGLVLAAVLASTSRGLFECLHETVDSCSLINKVSPVDLLGSLSYVQSIREVREGLEELFVTTIGVKGIDVRTELEGARIPVELFTEKMKPTVLEAFLKREFARLSEHVVMQVHRRIVRQSPYAQQFAIPLL